MSYLSLAASASSGLVPTVIRVRAATLTADAVIAALDSGDFYSTTGVALHEYAADDSGVRMVLAGHRPARAVFDGPGNLDPIGIPSEVKHRQQDDLFELAECHVESLHCKHTVCLQRKQRLSSAGGDLLVSRLRLAASASSGLVSTVIRVRVGRWAASKR